MTIHRPDRPDAPARVRRSALRPDRWSWRCLDKPTHHENGYPSWEDAFAAMEKHRRTEHVPALHARPMDGCSCFVVPGDEHGPYCLKNYVEVSG